MKTLSGRAQRYLESLKRRPAERDGTVIAERLEEAGFPATEEVIHFQQQFGGLEQMYGYNLFVWGLFHPDPEPESFLEPDLPDVFEGLETPFVSCANCHRSDHWFLDPQGALHWCFTPPLASSFSVKLERDALVAELFPVGPSSRAIAFEEPAQAIEILVPKIADGLVPEASDPGEALYVFGGLYAAVKGDSIQAYALADFDDALLEGIALKLPVPAPPSRLKALLAALRFPKIGSRG